MTVERLKQLQEILEKNYGYKCSDLEATVIGNSLIRYFDALLISKWKLEDEKKLPNNT